MVIEIVISLFLYIAGFFLCLRYCNLHDDAHRNKTNRGNKILFSAIWPLGAILICSVDTIEFLSSVGGRK